MHVFWISLDFCQAFFHIPTGTKPAILIGHMDLEIFCVLASTILDYIDEEILDIIIQKRIGFNTIDLNLNCVLVTCTIDKLMGNNIKNRVRKIHVIITLWVVLVFGFEVVQNDVEHTGAGRFAELEHAITEYTIRCETTPYDDFILI